MSIWKHDLEINTYNMVSNVGDYTSLPYKTKKGALVSSSSE
jgi:hypothetical protein